MKNKELAPICLFTYNRLSETKQTVAALQANYLASKSVLYIFSDGPKSDLGKLKIDAVREYLSTISGFQSVTILESRQNKGLANSIIEGVTQVINKHGRAIVLEDDIITLPNFLDFMNQALDRYKNDKRIFSITGYSKDLPSLSGYDKDVYLGVRASSWAWATWQHVWQKVDWSARGWWLTLLNPISHYRFTRGGSDMPYMLLKQMIGVIDSWAIRWTYSQYRYRKYTVISSQSLVLNIGFGADASNTKRSKRFVAKLGNSKKRVFELEIPLNEEPQLLDEFRHKYSIIARIKDRF